MKLISIKFYYATPRNSIPNFQQKERPTFLSQLFKDPLKATRLDQPLM